MKTCSWRRFLCRTLGYNFPGYNCPNVPCGNGAEVLEWSSPSTEKDGRKRRRKERARPPNLYISQILEWADAHFARMGRWPTRKSGFIRGTVNDTWMKIDSALLNGYRGLRKGSTLALLLMEHRGLRHPHHLPDLTEKQILQWADEHLVRTGDWPTKDSGKVTEAPSETWKGIHHALRYGYRGWPGGSTLARFLQDKRGVRNNLGLPPLTVQQILAWADAHYNRTGQWPTNRSGAITDAPNETWAGVQSALVQKGRGIKKKCSLALLLVKERGAQKHKHRANLTVRQIWTWVMAQSAVRVGGPRRPRDQFRKRREKRGQSLILLCEQAYAVWGRDCRSQNSRTSGLGGVGRIQSQLRSIKEITVPWKSATRADRGSERDWDCWSS